MLTYNTQRQPMVLPEYGRGIQQMVDQCLLIEDRDERTRAAYAIVTAMANLFPEMRQNEGTQRKLWDHLAMMAGFSLDIDWPVEPPHPEELDEKPLKVPYPNSYIRWRHYGRSVEQMAAEVTRMEPSPERNQLIDDLANHMKKLALMANPDSEVDARVMRDLAEYTHGAIQLDPRTYRLADFEITTPVTGKKKKRKK